MEKKQESKASKIINIVVMTIEIIVIIAGIALSIAVITGSKSTTRELGDGYNITVVLSNSMDGDVKDYKIKSFKAGDLVIVKKLEASEVRSLEIGDVATYLGVVNGEYQLVTHRVVGKELREDINVLYYETRGDAEAEVLKKTYPEGQMQGVVKFVIPKLGYVVNWFQQSKNFLFAVVIPLAALLIYNIIIFVKMVMNAKLKKLEEKNKQDIENAKKQLILELGGGDAAEKEEEIKRKAIEEYLAKQALESDTKKE